MKTRTWRLSARSIDDLVRSMSMGGISKSQVSRLGGEIVERVNAFLVRPSATGRISGSTPPTSKSGATTTSLASTPMAGARRRA